MALFVGGVKVNNFSIGPDTSPGDLVPEDMQLGRIGFSQGKRVVGTGKAFAFAEYGSQVVKKTTDSKGNELYGVSFKVGENTNVIFIAPSTIGDIVLQSNYIVNIESGESVKLGVNHTTGCDLIACYDTDRVLVYFTAAPQKTTFLRFFIGKDNHL